MLSVLKLMVKNLFNRIKTDTCSSAVSRSVKFLVKIRPGYLNPFAAGF